MEAGKDKKQISSKHMYHGYSEVFETEQLLYLQDIIITSISLLKRKTQDCSQKFSRNMKWINFRQTETCLFSNLQKKLK